MANKILGRVQSLEAALGFVVVAFDVHHDAGGTGVVRHEDGRDADQSDARVSQLAFENGIRVVELSESAQSLEDSLLDMTGASAEFTSA